jgi:predicted N-acetyltransferase YhbS
MMVAGPVPPACPVRRLGPGDAEAGAALSADAGWGHSVADWRCRIAFGAGIGCDIDGQLAAAGLLLPGPPGIAFFGMLLVAQAHRGQGLGAAVTGAALREAGRMGRSTVALFAVPKAVTLYSRLGFQEQGLLLSYRRGGDAAAAGSGHVEPGITVRPLQARDLPAVLALDRASYGADRAPMLHDQIARFPELSLVASDASGLQGFALASARTGLTVIGPVVASGAAAAIALTAALLARTDGAIRCDSLGVADGHRAAYHHWLEERGFAVLNRIPLMVFGAERGRTPFAIPHRLFAAQSAAAG